MEKTVRLTIHPERDGAEVVTAKSPGRPDADGVLRTFVIEPPEFDCGTYYAACQKYDIVQPPPDMWPEGANRIQPLLVTGFSGLKRGGIFLLLSLREGYLAVLPLAGRETLAWFHSQADDLVLRVDVSDAELVLVMREGGTLSVWSEGERVSAKGYRCEPVSGPAVQKQTGGLWDVHVPPGERDLVVRVKK